MHRRLAARTRGSTLPGRQPRPHSPPTVSPHVAPGATVDGTSATRLRCERRRNGHRTRCSQVTRRPGATFLLPWPPPHELPPHHHHTTTTTPPPPPQLIRVPLRYVLLLLDHALAMWWLGRLCHPAPCGATRRSRVICQNDIGAPVYRVPWSPGRLPMHPTPAGIKTATPRYCPARERGVNSSFWQPPGPPRRRSSPPRRWPRRSSAAAPRPRASVAPVRGLATG